MLRSLDDIMTCDCADQCDRFDLTGCDALVRGITPEPIIFELEDANGNIMDLTGWTGQSQVRQRSSHALIFNAEVTIFNNGSGGSLGFPADRWADPTLAPDSDDYHFDMILQDTTGAQAIYLLGEIEITTGATEWQSP